MKNGSLSSPRSHRRRRNGHFKSGGSSGHRSGVGFYGTMLCVMMICLAQGPKFASSWTPQQTPSKTSPPSLVDAAIHGHHDVMDVITASQKRLVLADHEQQQQESIPQCGGETLKFTVPVKWDLESQVERKQQQQQQRRLRQYEPAASRRSSVSLKSSSYDTDPNTEFELHVGRALDTLRADYPHLLTTCPDLSIYDRDIEVVDPSGVTVHGLQTYQNSFRILHALVKFLYCPSRSSMQFRMCFDKARRNIRIHWNAAVIPREIFGGSRKVLHVDGISVYELDSDTGNIVQHRIEQLLINNMPVRPKEGVIAALRDEHRVTVPSFFQPPPFDQSNILRFQMAGRGSLPTSLFAMEASESEDPQNSNNNAAANTNTGGSSGASKSGDGGGDGNPAALTMSIAFDPERFEAKNKSRKKFGLKPLTEDEFMEIELQVQQLDAEVKQRAAAQAAQKQEKPKQSGPSFVERLFGNVLRDTCETNWDCERPEVCCDFGFKKMCCSSGSLVANGVPQPALVPVPVEIADDPRNPRPRNF